MNIIIKKNGKYNLYKKYSFGFGTIKKLISFMDGLNVFGELIDTKEDYQQLDVDKDDYILVIDEFKISFYRYVDGDLTYIPIKKYLMDTLKDTENEKTCYDFLAMLIGKENLGENILGAERVELLF